MIWYHTTFHYEIPPPHNPIKTTLTAHELVEHTAPKVR